MAIQCRLAANDRSGELNIATDDTNPWEPCRGMEYPVLYIIGISHRAQSRKPNSEKTESQEVFERCLQKAIQEVNPVFVAEEDNEQFLADRGEVSIAREIVGESDCIEHRFCEPNREERLAIGSRSHHQIFFELVQAGLAGDELDIKSRAIEIARYFPIRQRFWLERLNGCRAANAIFICGDVHLESFGKLLEGAGIPNKMIKRGIGVTEEDEPYYRALQYLKEHPESI